MDLAIGINRFRYRHQTISADALVTQNKEGDCDHGDYRFFVWFITALSSNILSEDIKERRRRSEQARRSRVEAG
jgi:hypothetical protein